MNSLLLISVCSWYCFLSLLSSALNLNIFLKLCFYLSCDQAASELIKKPDMKMIFQVYITLTSWHTRCGSCHPGWRSPACSSSAPPPAGSPALPTLSPSPSGAAPSVLLVHHCPPVQMHIFRNQLSSNSISFINSSSHPFSKPSPTVHVKVTHLQTLFINRLSRMASCVSISFLSSSIHPYRKPLPTAHVEVEHLQTFFVNWFPCYASFISTSFALQFQLPAALSTKQAPVQTNSSFEEDQYYLHPKL